MSKRLLNSNHGNASVRTLLTAKEGESRLRPLLTRFLALLFLLLLTSLSVGILNIHPASADENDEDGCSFPEPCHLQQLCEELADCPDPEADGGAAVSHSIEADPAVVLPDDATAIARYAAYYTPHLIRFTGRMTLKRPMISDKTWTPWVSPWLDDGIEAEKSFTSSVSVGTNTWTHRAYECEFYNSTSSCLMDESTVAAETIGVVEIDDEL
jgi:hypothetical protein